MFEKRSKGVIESSDYTVVFHDGKSKGTSNEMKLLDKYNKPYEYYKFDRDEDWTVEMSDFDIDSI